MNVSNFIQEHKWALVIGGAAIVILYTWYENQVAANSGANNTISTGTSANTLDAETQLAEAGQAAQLQSYQISQQAAVANNQTAAAQSVDNTQTAAQVSEASYNSQDTLAAISAQQEIQDTANTLTSATTQAVSALTAQVDENTNATELAQTQANDQAYVDIASLPYLNSGGAFLTDLAQTNAQVNSLSEYANNSASAISEIAGVTGGTGLSNTVNNILQTGGGLTSENNINKLPTTVSGNNLT